MIRQTSTRTASFPGSDAQPQLDAALARLTTLVATIEADSAASGAAVALPRHRAALYAAMDALGGWINAFLAAHHARTIYGCSLGFSVANPSAWAAANRLSSAATKVRGGGHSAPRCSMMISLAGWPPAGIGARCLRLLT